MNQSSILNSSGKRTFLVFLSFYGRNYSRSGTILNFKDTHLNKVFIQVPTGLKLFMKLLKINLEFRHSKTIYVVMSPSHLLVPFLRVLTIRPIVLDAGWPLLDGIRSHQSKLGTIQNKIKTWLLDFISFHAANLIFFESRAQMRYSKRRYFLRRHKVAVSYTGFDETQDDNFQYNKQDSKLSSPVSPYVFFRGKVNDEAGIQNILNAFNFYDIYLPLVILTNQDFNLEVDDQKIKVIRGHFSPQEMADLYRGAALCLGQLSSHPRLSRTIPHKAFEAGFYGVPYISTKSTAINEIFQTEKSCYFINGVSPQEIANAINYLVSDSEILRNHGIEIHRAYQENMSQKKIHTDFMKTLTEKNLLNI